jgi:RIO kinase 1
VFQPCGFFVASSRFFYLRPAPAGIAAGNHDPCGVFFAFSFCSLHGMLQKDLINEVSYKMGAHASKHILDELADLEDLPRIRNLPGRQRRTGSTKKMVLEAHKLPAPTPDDVADQADGRKEFKFSYTAARHEAIWLVDSLGGFYEGQWLDDVLHLVKGGKEANVYQCLANESVQHIPNGYVAAKVYRPRMLRNLKNDHMYREGRTDLDSDGRTVNDDGMLHAMKKRTEWGRELLHTSWIEHEVKTMEILYAAGLDVPRPLASGDNAILMSYIGDSDVAAPTLNSIRLRDKQAQRLFDRMVHNIERMLACNRIHADLSAFNILYWDGDITIIDFPQAIHPDQNSNAFPIFERDVHRVCEYFQRQGVKVNPRSLATGIWKAQQRRTAPDINPALLDPDDSQDRRLWNTASK